jgi:hypothetical protein
MSSKSYRKQGAGGYGTFPAKFFRNETNQSDSCQSAVSYPRNLVHCLRRFVSSTLALAAAQITLPSLSPADPALESEPKNTGSDRIIITPPNSTIQYVTGDATASNKAGKTASKPKMRPGPAKNGR